MQNQFKTLLFQGAPLYYLEGSDGTNLVLIRPLCEAIGIDADWQIRELKANEMLAPELCEHTAQLPARPATNPVPGVCSNTPREDENERPGVCEHTPQVLGNGQSRSYTCLPEKYIYGWLFGIKLSNTMKPETKANLTLYKRECYDILFEHFHGQIRRAQQQVTRKATNAAEMSRVRAQMEARMPEQFQRLRELEAENKRIGNPLERLQNVQYRLDLDKALTEE